MERNYVMNAAFRAMLKGTKDMVFVKDANLTYVTASMPFVKMVGKERVEEIIGRTDLEIFDDENLARRYIADDKKLMDGGENLIEYIEPITEDHGKARYGSTSKYILRDENDKIIGLLGITRDVTRDYLARQRYQQELKFLFEVPKDTYAISYIDVDDWRIIGQRRQLIQTGTMQSCYTVERLCEAALESIIDRRCEAAAFYRKFSVENLKDIYASGRSNLSLKYQRRLSDGSVHWVKNDIRFMVDVDSGHLCVMLSAKNIDAQKAEEQKLVVAAKMDKMTMVLNRETTMENIQQVLKEEADKSHVLFMLDVDNFKSLNDTLGHQAGDEFLIRLAGEIRKNFRESDIVGRVGGDEFFALMKNVPGISETTRKAQELMSTIQKVCTNYPEIKLSGSIGIGIYPENGKTLGELYAQADAALYQAKRSGKNQFIFASQKNNTTIGV
ncbi:MAG: GGDEF domain-containing protein [Lachnospiraceae bacterium]|nr:GGDEF domain-containing protein [Lachnospiraceae bacterium]